jgi:hypothetical protein
MSDVLWFFSGFLIYVGLALIIGVLERIEKVLLKIEKKASRQGGVAMSVFEPYRDACLADIEAEKRKGKQVTHELKTLPAYWDAVQRGGKSTSPTTRSS